MAQIFDILAIGNAIVDVICLIDDDFLKVNQLVKGAATLVDETVSESLYQQLAPMLFSAGGSAANSLAGIASFGGKTGYIGRIKNDVLGQIFVQYIRQDGTDYFTKPARSGPATARCLVFVSPDAQRTMQTYLGASIDLTIHDIDLTAVKSSKVLLIESYLFDPPHGKDVVLKTVELAKNSGNKVALGASDFCCVDRHKQALEHFIPNYVDVLFANEKEAFSLTKKHTIEDAAKELQGLAPLTVFTIGEQGALIITPKEIIEAPPPTISQVVDTGGAGDQYAGGFLYAYANNLPLQDCIHYANIAAAEALSHLGPRPRKSLKALL